MVRLNLEKADRISEYEITAEDIQEKLGLGKSGYEALVAGELDVTLDMLMALSDLYNVLLTDLLDYDNVKFGVLDCNARRIRGRAPKVLIEMDYHLRTASESLVGKLRLVHIGDFEFNVGSEISLDLRFVMQFSNGDDLALFKALAVEDKEKIRKVMQEYIGYALEGLFTLTMYRKVKVGVSGI